MCLTAILAGGISEQSVEVRHWHWRGARRNCANRLSVQEDSNQAAYVQWTKTGTHVSGTIEDAYLDLSDSTQVATKSQSLSGVISADSITLTLGQSLFGATNL